MLARIKYFLWLRCGRLLFWLSWPLLKVYLSGSNRARVLVVSGSSVLLVKVWHGDGTWSLPGGGRHQGETGLLAAQRELAEETGLRLDKAAFRLLGEYTYRAHGLQFDYDLFVAKARTASALRPQPLEIVEAHWFDLAEIKQINCSQDVHVGLAAWRS